MRALRYAFDEAVAVMVRPNAEAWNGQHISLEDAKSKSDGDVEIEPTKCFDRIIGEIVTVPGLTRLYDQARHRRQPWLDVHERQWIVARPKTGPVDSFVK